MRPARILAVAVSAGLHSALLVIMNALPPRVSVAATHIVEMQVRKVEPPPPPPPPPEEVKKEPPPPEVRPKLVKKKTVEKVVADEPKPAPEPVKPPPPPMGFSVDMSNTSATGNIAVPAIDGGGNMFADPNNRTLEPGKKTTEAPPKPQTHGRGAQEGSYQITQPPEFIGSEQERTPPYPDSAKEREIQGQVLLNVYVGTSGRVEQVKVLQHLEKSCDEIAVKWAREHWRFKPAMAGEEPVAMWIPVPVTFVLEH
jgi:protein TonB